MNKGRSSSFLPPLSTLELEKQRTSGTARPRTLWGQMDAWGKWSRARLWSSHLWDWQWHLCIIPCAYLRVSSNVTQQALSLGGCGKRWGNETQGPYSEIWIQTLSKVSCMSIPTPSGVTVGSYIEASEMTGCQLWRCQCFPQKLVQSQSFWWKGRDTEKHNHCIKMSYDPLRPQSSQWERTAVTIHNEYCFHSAISSRLSWKCYGL